MIARALLRAHVLRRADDDAGGCEGLPFRDVQGARDAEVAEIRVVPRQENVRRCHVAVQHAVLVRGGECIGDLAHDHDCVVHRKLLHPRQTLPQCFALHVRHDIERQSGAGAPRMEHVKNARMTQTAGDADLTKKALRVHCARNVFPQHLHGDETIGLQVASKQDDRHPSASELADDAETSGNRFSRHIRELSHRPPTMIVGKHRTKGDRGKMAGRDS